MKVMIVPCLVLTLIQGSLCLGQFAPRIDFRVPSSHRNGHVSQRQSVNVFNTSIDRSNELYSHGFTHGDLLNSAAESLRVFVKALRSNRSIEEAMTISVTAFATSRTIKEIEGSLKNSKLVRNREFDLAKSASVIAVGSLAVLPPIIYPKYFRSMDEAWFADNRQIQKFLTSSLVGLSESLMGWVERSVDDFPSFPRLDAQECMKRGICEAHNQPKKYGLVGLVLQLFFPPYTETDEPSRIVSKYQLAARYGRQDNANCAAQYDGCVVNLLDMMSGILNFLW